ncbi:MAG: peptide deformylase [Candidatus Eremiobacteraeota bacterium]|nr:peptide deformylase [Candidatus Eremiobacteraeota bacterium]
MALRPIRFLGEQVLRRKAKDVEKLDAYIIQLLNDMVDTMYQNRGIGLAANQVGVLKKLIVIDIGEGLIKLINPRILKKEGSEVCTEACLSMPDMLGEVDRATEVTVKAYDEKFKPFEITGRGLLARVLQHEIDHLQGRLFIDMATNVRKCPPPEEEQENP